MAIFSSYVSLPAGTVLFFLAAIDPSPHESFRLSPDEPFVFDMVRLAANQVDRRVRVTLG